MTLGRPSETNNMNPYVRRLVVGSVYRDVVSLSVETSHSIVVVYEMNLHCR